MPEPGSPPTSSEIVFYQGEDGRSRIQVRLDGGTVWLPQVLMAELFQTTKQNISLHIKHIFADGELDPSATVKQYLTVQTEGSRMVRRALDHYSLDMILAVGYRVRSHRGTQFRRWATELLREYVVKGFVLDDAWVPSWVSLSRTRDGGRERSVSLRGAQVECFRDADRGASWRGCGSARTAPCSPVPTRPPRRV